MRSGILTMLFLSAACYLHGQGNVNFANVGVGLNSPFTNQDAGGARLDGGTWTVELLAGADPGSLAPAGAAYTGSFAIGFFNAGQRTVSNVTGNLAMAQVRVWDNRGGTITTWFEAAATEGVCFGQTGLFSINLTVAPTTPATMVNMPAIALICITIPEPSTLVLGLLGGVGALLLRRR